MRKRVYGRRLSRDTNERKALFRSLAIALVTHGHLNTTEAKAKAVRPWIEKLVTRAKVNDLTSHRVLLEDLPSVAIVEKMLTAVGPTFAGRPGGYTRIVRLGPRTGDNAPMVRLEFVEEIKAVKPKKEPAKRAARPIARKAAPRKRTPAKKTVGRVKR